VELRDRRIRLQGSYNFRDLGGYTTAEGRSIRWERLYRSDALFRLTQDDLETLKPLGISTLIDLRTMAEVERTGPSPLLAAHGTRHRHHPFLNDPVDQDDLDALPALSDLYAGLLTTGAETIRGVFDTLANTSTYPAVIHCAVGKDRTGIMVAILLRSLGVADETIAADYAITETNFAELIAFLQATNNTELLAEINQVRPEILAAPAATMREFLALIDSRFGGTAQLLTDSGVPAGAVAEVRSQVLTG
jgi:protein tyrosine/serine phosphatase